VEGRGEAAPRLDFLSLVDYVRAHYGALNQGDFVAAANFSHYDRQKGGLNQVATLVHVDSFEPRQVRNQIQPTPGKKRVVKDYADMRLAYEIGRHVSASPADMYILASGDKSFAAVGQALRAQGISVLFLLSFPDLAAVNIKEEFTWIDFSETQALEQALEKNAQETGKQTPEGAPARTQVDELCDMISALRQEFSTAVPLALVKAVYGSQHGHHLVQAAQSQGRVDLWDDPGGVACVSRREERVFNKVVPMSVRRGFAARADLLYRVVHIAESGLKEPTRAEWRRALKEQGGMSVKDAKQMLNDLLERGILKDGSLDKLDLSLDRVLQFLQETHEAAS